MTDDCKVCLAHSGLCKEIKALRDKIDERQKQVDFQVQAIRDMSKQSEKVLDRRLNTMNEIREQLDRQARTFVSIEKIDGLEEKFNYRISSLEKESFSSGGESKWRDYLVMAIMSGAIVLFLRLVLKV